jgi:hypothetical protein
MIALYMKQIIIIEVSCEHKTIITDSIEVSRRGKTAPNLSEVDILYKILYYVLCT